MASTTLLRAGAQIAADPHRHGTVTLQIPTPMLRDLERCAERVGQSVSWCLCTAWTIAAEAIAQDGDGGLPREHHLLKGRRRPTSVELPFSTWRTLTLETERLDRSRSWLLQRAWLVARPEVLATTRQAS